MRKGTGMSSQAVRTGRTLLQIESEMLIDLQVRQEAFRLATNEDRDAQRYQFTLALYAFNNLMYTGNYPLSSRPAPFGY
jgi:hypothetical protein